MKQFITSYLIDRVDDGETTLKEDGIDDAVEYIWQAFDCTDFYDQVDRLTIEYLAKK